MERTYQRAADEKIEWVSSLPYVGMHVAAVVGAFVFPFNLEMLAVVVGLYYLRMFGITAGYHRYFAHRGFKTGRVFQFILALLGTMSSQKGVLWWSGHHRHHHKFSDLPEDIHSPKRGFWWSHHEWFLCPKYNPTPAAQLKEFEAYPEILWLNRNWALPVIGLGLVLLAVGGWGAAFWGTIVSTVLLYHGTFTINSLAHVWGSRRYETTDTSRNNFVLAVLTMGEGWHNNHHHYQSTARNGFFWWEIDLSWYLLKALSFVGIVWDLREPPRWVLEGKKRRHDRESFAFPASLLDDMQAISTLRTAVETRPADEPATRLGELAMAAAQKAADVAERAAKVSSKAKARLAASAADAAERAAAVAMEAAEAASHTRAHLKTAVAEGWASAAQTAAQNAAAAAARARAAAA